MKTYISKEDAYKLFLENSCYSADEGMDIMDKHEFHKAVNLAIAKVIGEPVSIKIATEPALTILGVNEAKLYAIKELPNE